MQSKLKIITVQLIKSRICDMKDDSYMLNSLASFSFARYPETVFHPNMIELCNGLKFDERKVTETSAIEF